MIEGEIAMWFFLEVLYAASRKIVINGLSVGTTRDSGGQTGGYVLKFLKNKKMHVFQKVIIFLSKTTCDDFIQRY